MLVFVSFFFFFFFKQKTAYEMRISDWSSDVCSSDLVDYYRGKLVTDSQGNYRVRTTMPVPYQIPYEGPTGRLLGHLGSHTWRPAHVHFKVRKDGFEPLTTQYYFEGGKWVDDDRSEESRGGKEGGRTGRNRGWGK